MEFSEEFMSNPMFTNHALSFEKPAKERIDGVLEDTGVKFLPNGDAQFRIYAPKAEEIKVFLFWNDEPLVLTKREKGFFEGIYPYNPSLTGPVGVRIVVDGAEFLSPYVPIFWTGMRPMNYIEVPDPDMEFAMVQDVPHGSYTRELYYAKNVSRLVRCMVYTPPGYMKNDQEYPVLYLLHGATDNETTWQYNANVAEIMDNLIAAGKCVPCIVVMNDGMLRYRKIEEIGAGEVWDLALEDLLADSCIPYIESHYRVQTGKWNRAIAGLSMGSYQSCDIATRRPELFAYVGQFTAGITQDPTKWTFDRKYQEALADPEQFARTYKVYYRSTTPKENHFEYFEADDAIYAKAGVDRLPNYVRKVYPADTSRWKSWRLGLRDFVQLIFR